MEDDILKSMTAAICVEMGMQVPDTITEEELLRLLTDKVANVIQQGQEPFYRWMYRLDISERKINALTGTDDVAAKVARLIFERQLAKAQTRRQFRQNAADNADDDLKW